ncbi:MAG: hypothetical protein M0Q92_07420 [Methanoregula sp.]|jgi:hypothetical protein|nr:hypothetical protein [Methanoregula sp.]
MKGILKIRSGMVLAAILLVSLCTGSVLAAEDPGIKYRDLVKMNDGGYVLAGTWEIPIGKQPDSFRYRGNIVITREDPDGAVIWNRIFGGEKNDEVWRIIQVSDGGFLVVGQTESFGTGAWVIRTDADGRELWNKTFGRRNTDSFSAVAEMRDGGFALAGASDAYTGKGQGAWLVRIDSQGAELWNRTFGGDVFDNADSVAEYPDGGLVVAGVTNTGTGQLDDALLIRTDSTGNLLWKKTFGGRGTDEARSVIITSDGSIVFTGSTFTTGLNVDDFWVVKTDAGGNEIWNRKFSDSGLESGMAIVEAPDNGFFVVETVASQVWKIKLVKLDADGTRVWEREYTGIDPETLLSWGGFNLVLHPDGTLFLSGPGSLQGTWSIDAAADGTETGRQVFGLAPPEVFTTPETTYRQPYAPSGWFVRTDAQGAELWNTTFGDTRIHEPFSVRQIPDGGYVIAGSAMNNGDHSDAWLTFFDDKGQETSRVIIGSDGLAEIHSMQQLPDGGFILVGKHDTSGWESTKIWLVRTDKTGSRQWEKDLPDLVRGEGESVVRTSDGGYVIAGSARSQDGPSADGVIVKTDADGSVVWKQIFGGPEADNIPRIYQVPDGGYVAMLVSVDYAGLNPSTTTATLLRLDDRGAVVWSRPLTENMQVEPMTILATTDGGYLVAGYAINEDSGLWIMKTDGSGNPLWHHVYDVGTFALKGSELVIEVPGGGYALAGNKGEDIWLIRMDQSGTELWNRTYGGWSGENVRALHITSDGGFVIAGTTTSWPASETPHTGRLVPLLILFTAILAGGAIVLYRNERNRGGKES